MTPNRGRIPHILVIVLLLVAPARKPPQERPLDPASDLARVRAFITTASSSLDLGIRGAEWANAACPDSSVRVIIDGGTVHITRRSSTQAEIQLDVILASVHPGSNIEWTLTPILPGSSAIEIYNFNRPTMRLVDRFDAGNEVGRLSTVSDLMREGGPLPVIPPVRQHLALAFFYPWYNVDTWSTDSKISDSPIQAYSTADPVDLAHLMSTAKGVGVDALVQSWAGKDFNGGVDHNRMLRSLAAAQTVGFKMAALFETTVANPQHIDGDADADTVLRWLIDVVDDYASQPAYLRVDGRPVVLAYAAQRLTQAGWTSSLARLRATGRKVLLIGEGINSTRLGAFDGQFYYPSNVFQGDAIQAFDRGQSLNVRTYHLLPNDAVGRRVWVATVSPGYDDSRTHDGRVNRVTDRANGRYYDTQWRAAFDNRADWIVITSWNEYFENTEIEATHQYGDLYLRLTRSWRTLFRQLEPFAVPRP